MKDHPWDLNQTWPVGRTWCQFINASQKFRGLPQNLGYKTSNFGPLFPWLPHWTPYTSRTKRSMDKQKTSVNLQCVRYEVTYFPWPLTQKRLRSVCLFWRHIWRPFRWNHQSCDISSFDFNVSYL